MTDVVAFEHVQGADFGCQWHFHPELELTLVLSGGTHRWIGDKFSAIEENDLVLIGSNLPHDYRNEASSSAQPLKPVDALVVQFHPDFLGSLWLEGAQMGAVKRLLQDSGYGLQITGPTRSHIGTLMLKMEGEQGLQRLITLLEILLSLSQSEDLMRIASPGFSPEVEIADAARIGKITEYIQKHLYEPLYLNDVAKHMGMTEVSFSRYFRSRTGKTFPAYLNELRIAKICRLLIETDATVTEIAINCGFDSIANFEKQFRRLHGCSPTMYRSKATGAKVFSL